jgi:hypothetical protein|tara:strand:+ start:616 stop:1206 length:591 start_codon:yes stop_codon:yes gene_type:complete
MQNFEETINYESDNETTSSHTTLVSSVKDDDQSILSDGIKQMTKTIRKKRDNDCYKILIEKKVKINRKGKKPIYKIKKAPVYFYETNCDPGSTIRDAITGHYYTGYHTGKIVDEALFYSTAYCVGDACKPGQKIGDNRDAQHLFFANPESFERLFKTRLTEERKQRWVNDFALAKQKDSRTKRDTETKNKVYTIIK